uniref:Papain family cysteine protease n=1 Tax=Marseillevirus LCMAC201 TaxID=2506605 RepID=A0A481YWN1_9VIRU|nr:MAG: papain family cysteine protease [Marseillevirus LCMAC201]
MYVMKEVLLLLIITLFGIFYLCYYHQTPIEGLNETLRDPAHLSATVYRATNTILTAANIYSDAMDKLPLPTEITDAYNEWINKGFISPIKDQMLCGGCWAFATCASLTDRLTIATNGHWYPLFGLSEQILISCGGDMGMQFYQGCEGGIPHFAIDALTKNGVPADSKCLVCSPGDSGGSNGTGLQRSGGVVNPNNASTCNTGGNVYAATNYTWWQTGCDGNTSCSLAAASTCPCAEVNAQMKQLHDNVSSPFNVKYKTIGEAHNYTVHGKNNELHTVDLWPNIPQEVITKNVIRMKKAIYYEGPITIGYRVTQDFYTFWPTSAVDNYYKYDGRSPMTGGHAVVIVGWKKMADGTPVWIVKNSWGANGGYGFPDGPKWNNPVTGKSQIKYLGGFWNHIMGINDSFIESNASGAHPNLHIPEINKYIDETIPPNWNKIMTLRDVYLKTAESKGKPPVTPPVTPIPLPVTPIPPPVTPIPLPPVTPIPAEEPGYTPIVLSSDKFNVVNLTPDNITPQALEEFFSRPDSMYMVGANDTETVNTIMSLLPIDKDRLSENDIQKLSRDIQKNIKGYILIAAKGDTNNYYYMDGDPVDWASLFNKDYANRAATIKKFVDDIYSKFQGLRLQAPVVQLSKIKDLQSFKTSRLWH